MSHYIEDTHQIICVYCAFNIFKKNPKYEIKEINDKCTEILGVVDNVLADNQNYVETLRRSLDDVKTNKQDEEEKINNLFDQISAFLINKKAEALENIDLIFSNNTKMISDKLEYFCTKIENAEEMKGHIQKVMNNQSYRINDLLANYSQYLRDASDPSKLNLELQDYKYSHDEENKLFKYLNNFGDLKTKTKFVKFTPKNFIQNAGNSLGNMNNTGNSASLLTNDLKNLNLSSGGIKKNYESNYSNTNPYNRNDILNTSDILNDNNEYMGGRANTQHKSNYNFGNSEKIKNDLLTSGIDSNFPLSTSSKI